MKKFLLPILILISLASLAQTTPVEEDTQNWDNIMYAGNRFTYGSSDKLRHSAEFQTRYKDNLSALEQWHIEYAATYLYKENWEIVPDFRFTRKPTRYEYRPGIGVIYKDVNEEKQTQLVHQFKYQYDFKGGIPNTHGIRYALFYNKVINDELVITALAGGLFEFGDDFNGFLGMRTGISAAYVINKAHSVNVGYFYGLINEKTNDFTNVGVFSLQLIINISRDYKYLPAKYFSL
ncbi:MAG: hypothetical protein BM563_04830 [Bacteroidetes bacterium MedPE-SWsnd-G1]|nr:MAG: hypothetical protein BM563_04830 [Bacteroidetes bacterium MedPE-SWsnd-G1]